MIQQTSLFVFLEVEPDLARCRKEVYEAIKELGEACNEDIQKKLDWKINSVTPRVFELRKKDLVIESKKHLVNIVGEQSYTGRLRTIDS